MTARAKRTVPGPKQASAAGPEITPKQMPAAEASLGVQLQLDMLRRAFTPTPQSAFWLRLLRPHQWAKNALVVVPLLTAHHFSAPATALMLMAFAAFCAGASSAYSFNDLIDIEADRAHPMKRTRPLANGDISKMTGAVICAGSLGLAFALATCISWAFVGVLAVYFAGTTVYSLYLKRMLMIDTVTLAGLYTIRVIGGAVAIAVPTSEWLLAFSMFVFLSLALIKRYSELALRLDAELPDPTDRNYKVTDLPVIAALAAASGYGAAIVLSLYISSDMVRALYRHPSILWLACPVFVFWISRMLMLSHRRVVSEDPIVFTMTDKASWAAGAAILVLGILAT